MPSTSPSSTQPNPWYHPLTMDLLIKVLSNSLLHPFIACLIPLCLRAVATPFDSPRFLIATAYAILLIILSLFSIANHRIAYGTPRDVNLEDEVIVITGGAGGLGGIIAEIYGMKGVSVAVLDVRKPEWVAKTDGGGEEMETVRWYECDVGDRAQVEKVGTQIEKDLGTPTILINNAGIVNGKPLLDLTAEEIERTFRVNTLSHFHTIQKFLPGMLRLGYGTIVTVSSVLAHLGAANLSAYTSSKSALLTLHTSLTAELSSLSSRAFSPYPAPAIPQIKTILLTPGHLTTPLFSFLPTPSPFFGPVVEAKDLAIETVRMIDAGESGEISMPFYTRWIGVLGVLPVGMQRVARAWSEIDEAMTGVLRRSGGEGKEEGLGQGRRGLGEGGG